MQTQEVAIKSHMKVVMRSDAELLDEVVVVAYGTAKKESLTGSISVVDNKKIGLPLIIFCNVSLAVHDDEHIERFKEEIRNIDEIMECYSTGGIYDFFVKVVLKDLDAYNQFVFEKLTKVHGIVKMQSSFVLNEIKHTTVLNIPKNS